MLSHIFIHNVVDVWVVVEDVAGTLVSVHARVVVGDV